MELIYADENFNEVGEITCFSKFDAQVGLKTENIDSDFELTMHEKVWAASSIVCGGYVYVPGTAWGGRVDRIVHSAAEEKVHIYGTCWRGLLERFAVVPPEGQTHMIITEMEANTMLRELVSSAPAYISVENRDSGICCSGSIRYKSFLNAAEKLLMEQDAGLRVRFDGGKIIIGAYPVTNHSDEIEFSQEYDSSLVSTVQGEMYNHIIALGQGTMEERDIVELWKLRDGTISSDGASPEMPDSSEICTYIYDYGSVESRSALMDAARQKLTSLCSCKKLEISIGSSDVCLELGDTAGARDILTGMTAEMKVTATRLEIQENSISVTHTLS